VLRLLRGIPSGEGRKQRSVGDPVVAIGWSLVCLTSTLVVVRILGGGCSVFLTWPLLVLEAYLVVDLGEVREGLVPGVGGISACGSHMGALDHF